MNLILLFFTYSLVGWIWETCYESVLNKKIINRGFLNGPCIPIYGCAGSLVYIFLQKYQTTFFSIESIKIYFVGMIIATVLEYITSYLMEKIFNTKWWDYTEYKFNLNGRICLIASLFWGFAIVFFIQVCNPLLISKYNKISHDIKLSACSVFITAFIIDLFVTIYTIANLQRRIDFIIAIENERLENFVDKISLIPSSAKNKFAEIKLKSYEITDPLIRRLVLAFPKMKIKKLERQSVFSKIAEKIKRK